MLALILTALFTVVALVSAVTIADAVVRSRNAFRHMRGELAHASVMEGRSPVTIRYVGEPDALPLPPLRSLTISAARRMRKPARPAEPRRAAA